MESGDRKSSEDMVREANLRFGSAPSSPEARLETSAGKTVSMSERPHEPASAPETLLPPDPIERRVSQGSSFSGRWIVWGILLLAAAGWGFVTSLDDADRDGAGEIVGGGDLDVMTLQVGDCFDDPEQSSDVVYDVAAVPCSAPHDNEVFALHSVAGTFVSDFPGRETLERHGYEICSGSLFETYVGTTYIDSELDVFTMTPSDESWSQGDREIVCALYRVDLSHLTGSARGTGL